MLNLVSPAACRGDAGIIDARRPRRGRTPPRLTVWVPVALDPGAPHRQLAAQLAVYLAPPGYGEMFCELGFADLVARARAGARRAELAAADPRRAGRPGVRPRLARTVAARLRAYHQAGADTVAIVPVTAEDPGGPATLDAPQRCDTTQTRRCEL